MIVNGNHIIADRGKVFIRKADTVNFGNEIYLGNAYYLYGEKLETPFQEVAEDFEEVDDPQILDNESPHPFPNNNTL